jgi:hypothetical protein
VGSECQSKLVFGSGAITEALIYGEAAARGVIYDKGWMIGVTTTVKIFIDIFFGVWVPSRL